MNVLIVIAILVVVYFLGYAIGLTGMWIINHFNLTGTAYVAVVIATFVLAYLVGFYVFAALLPLSYKVLTKGAF
ncbi:MAG: hypothetical protein DRR06_20445 [Gammaproteobacteria bacterium]|nr:MAG: hypothetical protein DRR06_20445 [Gammaproteobacteria bacterium]